MRWPIDFAGFRRISTEIERCGLGSGFAASGFRRCRGRGLRRTAGGSDEIVWPG